jgi:hypothetical protein
MATHQTNYPTISLQNGTLVLMALAVVLAVALFAVFRSKSTTTQHLIIPIALLSPTPTPPKTQETVVLSPDGKKTLIMKEKDEQQGKTYSVYTSEPEATPTAIFSKTVDYNSSIEIPFNTWSNDNKYVFLKERFASDSAYYVVESTGTPISSDTPYLNISEYFKNRLPLYVLEDVTGWASPTLLVVNTKTLEGNEGPSFWFEIPSHSFIQLSSRFN